MVTGAPDEARWMRSKPRRRLPAAELERMVRTAFPNSHVVDAQPFDDGLRNANFKLLLDSSPQPVVLRIYEHDASLCQKEVDLIRRVNGAVPVADVIHAEPAGLGEFPPFALMRYIEGISFRELKRGGGREAIAQAAASAGEMLAAIGRVTFPTSGWIGPGPAVTAPLLEGPDPLPRFVDLCLASVNLQRRMDAELRERTHNLVWSCAQRLARLEDEPRLVHGDFNKRNLLVRAAGGRWSVAAVLDWEFAVAGSPLADIGNFLRYEKPDRPLAEPHFSNGYLRAGGMLPEDWRRLAKVLDLAALCESLTHEDLSVTIDAELVELVAATR